jgi:hypothetical protein
VTDGAYALVGVALGAALGVAGTAVVERWRHSYIRKDARTDRQAATLREALDAYTEFVIAWSPVSYQVATGKTVDMRDPAIVAGPPALAHRRLVAVTERVHIESIRHRLATLIDNVVRSVADGKVSPTTIDANAALGTQVAADIGSELRKLEAQ